METVATPGKRDINILSNRLFKAASDTPNKKKVNSQVPRARKATKSSNSEEQPVLFKNLAFELPIPKRKNDFNYRETAKKLRTESSNDDCGAGDDNNAKIFNYLTGTYESVETVRDELPEDSLEINEEVLSFNESTLIEEHTIIKDDPIESLEVFNFDCVDKSSGMGEQTTIENKDDVEVANESRLEPTRNSTVATSGGSEATSEHNGRESGREFQNKTLEIPLAFKCFDCDTVFDDRSGIEMHASLIHSMSAFKCDLHCLSKEFANECSKCVYESILNNSPNSRRINDHIASEDDGDTQECSIGEIVNLSGHSQSSERKNGESPDCFGFLLNEQRKPTRSVIFIQNLINSKQIRTMPHQATIVEIDEENDRIEENIGASAVTDVHETKENNDVISETRPQLIVIDDNNREGSEVVSGLDENCDEITVHKDINKISESGNFQYMPHQDTSDCTKSHSRTTLSDVDNKLCLDCEFTTTENDLFDEKYATFKIDVENGKIEENNSASEVIDVHEIVLMANSETEENGDAVSEIRPPLDAIEDNRDGAKKISGLDDSCDEIVVRNGINEISEKKVNLAVNDIGTEDTNDNDCPKCFSRTTLSDAEKQNKRCLDCGFTTDKNNLCRESFSPGDIKCFQCPYVTSHKRYLYYHAVNHVLEDFACDKNHTDVTNASSDICFKCIYEYYLGLAKKNVLACKICSFKTVIVSVFDMHQCNKSCVAPYTCWDCHLGSFNTIDELREHAAAHYKSEFRCKDHGTAVNNCSQCLYQALVDSLDGNIFVSRKCLSEESFGLHSAGTCSVSATPSKFKCFHCDYQTNDKTRLKYHCKSLHYCEIHPKTPRVDCPKCIYQKQSSGTEKTLFACTKCNFKTLSELDYKSHQSDEAYCVAYLAEPAASRKSLAFKSSETYTCFDCDFSHERLDFLKFHVREHRASKFQCDEHKTPKQDCPKCRYVQLVFATIRGRLCCYDCDKRELFAKLLDLHRHVAEEHPRSNFACTLHIAEKDTCCGKCLYEDIVRDVIGDNYVKLICWDCDGKLFSRMANYENHILYLHSDSKFLCCEHYGRNYKRCSKCLYQKMLQRHSIVSPPPKSLTFKCLQCNYSGKYLLLFISHVNSTHKDSDFKCKEHPDSCRNDEYCPQCFFCKMTSDEPSSMPLIRCYECTVNYKWSYNRLYYLKSHIRKNHKKCSYVCTLHPNEGGINCIQCYFETLVQDLPQLSLFRYECFICTYASDSLNLYKFHIHQLHKDSKYTCKRHLNEVVIDCAQCFYATIVSEASTNNIICYACVNPTTLPHINTLREHIVDDHKTGTFICPSHIVKDDDCDKCLFQRRLEIIREQQRISLICPDCNYTTAKFSTLRYHVWQQHMDSQYQCKEHLNKPVACLKCSYATMLKNLRNFTCYLCETLPTFSGVDPLSSHIYRVHENDFFVCPDEHFSSNSDCAKCLFQKLLIDVFTLQCHYCIVPLLFSDKDRLKSHKIEYHTRLVCSLHPIGPSQNNCGECYCKRSWREKKRKACSKAARGSFPNFECFNCNYETDKDVIMKWHIQKEHSDSGFTCGTHSLSEIDLSCSECRYENLILQVKEHLVLSL